MIVIYDKKKNGWFTPWKNIYFLIFIENHKTIYFLFTKIYIYRKTIYFLFTNFFK